MDFTGIRSYFYINIAIKLQIYLKFLGLEMNEEISNYLNKLRSQGLLRILKQNSDKKVIADFSSNDYLSLSKNLKSINAGIEAAKKFGTGSTGSRLLSGNPEIFLDFERQIAVDKNFKSALIFNSGFIANFSVISAFSNLDYLIFFDKLNHASMYQGVSPKKLLRFNHLNYHQLEKFLEEHKNYSKKLIASETVFGMDGDVADLTILIDLAKKYEAILYLDEAHATGLYGKNGYGISTNFSQNTESTIVMGTFSKALASSGAYVVCSDIFKNYLIQVSKGFVYSTALSPFCIGIAAYNWRLLPQLSEIRKEIVEKAKYLRNELSNMGYKYTGSGTNIIAIIFNSIVQMLDINKKLLENGIITSAVRRPTSPTPRLRLALNAKHSYDDINLLLKYLGEYSE